MYIPSSSLPPSPQAQELGQKIAQIVREYSESNPGLSVRDVSQAFTVAKEVLGAGPGGIGKNVYIALGVLIGLVVLGVFFGLYALRDSTQIPIVAVVAVLVLVLGLVAVMIPILRR